MRHRPTGGSSCAVKLPDGKLLKFDDTGKARAADAVKNAHGPPGGLLHSAGGKPHLWTGREAIENGRRAGVEEGVRMLYSWLA